MAAKVEHWLIGPLNAVAVSGDAPHRGKGKGELWERVAEGRTHERSTRQSALSLRVGISVARAVAEERGVKDHPVATPALHYAFWASGVIRAGVLVK
ncbi:hypothetical protein ACFWGP_05470 [Agromyces sp. NPDC127015]|uniref:hypothetical protein n=1 Tax=Agromyces sp. NPDC127015 TaxID=3347108 RepID=UPI003652F9AB